MTENHFRVECACCGKYLFTETKTERGFKREESTKAYHYRVIDDTFVCDECEEYIDDEQEAGQ